MDANCARMWFATAGLGVLTLNSALTIYRAKGDAGAVAFVVASYSSLLLLLACHCLAPGASSARERWKTAAWALTTLRIAMFAWKVVALMQWTVAGAVVWGLAVATSLGGFFTLFVHGA